MTKQPSSELMPLLNDLTENERAWVGFMRLISNDTDPAPTLAKVQALRGVFSKRIASGINTMPADP